MSYTISYTARNTGVERTSGLLYPKCPTDLNQANLTHVRRGPAFQETCPICLSNYLPEVDKEKLIVTLLPCGHFYHVECISRINALTCPLCVHGLNENFFSIINSHYSSLIRDTKPTNEEIISYLNVVSILCYEDQGLSKALPTPLNARLLCRFLRSHNLNVKRHSLKIINDLLNFHRVYFFQYLVTFLKLPNVFTSMKNFLQNEDNEGTFQSIRLIGNLMLINPQFENLELRFGNAFIECNAQISLFQKKLNNYRRNYPHMYHGNVRTAHNNILSIIQYDARSCMFRRHLANLVIEEGVIQGINELSNFLDENPMVPNLFFDLPVTQQDIVEVLFNPNSESPEEITCIGHVARFLSIVFTQCSSLVEGFYSEIDNLLQLVQSAETIAPVNWECSLKILKLLFILMDIGQANRSDYPAQVINYYGALTDIFIENQGMDEVIALYNDNNGNDPQIQAKINYWVGLIAVFEQFDDDSESISTEDSYSDNANDFYNNGDHSSESSDQESDTSEEGYDLEDPDNSDDE